MKLKRKKKEREKLINGREVEGEKRTEIERSTGNTKMETEKKYIGDRIRAILNRRRVERKD